MRVKKKCLFQINIFYYNIFSVNISHSTFAVNMFLLDKLLRSTSGVILFN